MMKILVVDDDQQFADSIAMRCRSLGFEVETANTPLAAIVGMTDCPPDLLCFDVNMPTANGLDLCEHLVRNSTMPPKPVIILTGQTDQATRRRSATMGTRYVQKSPNVWQELRPIIEEFASFCRDETNSNSNAGPTALQPCP